MTKKLFLGLTLVVVMSVACRAQNGFIKGYVITNTNDTLFGEVKDRSGVPHILFSKVKFRKEDGTKKSSFSAKQIKGYKKGNDVFESITCYDDEIVFAKVVHSGFLSLYRYEMDGENGNTFLLKKEGNPCVTEVNSFEMKNQMIGYFNDCNAVQAKINGEQFNNDQLAELVSIYNNSCQAK